MQIYHKIYRNERNYILTDHKIGFLFKLESPEDILDQDLDFSIKSGIKTCYSFDRLNQDNFA
ncbi:hypothetical protein BpHYR1_004319 [Brachionus plicatilis]|uniref:Uncharacterized protein n=1 Tax=Brachionus plicatilis TaxID=10195 RepID=A0A3M7RVG6_BRAPC|nr:hypothetical protein BpHYR1_004319 [Brachionus plicatilis]